MTETELLDEMTRQEQDKRARAQTSFRKLVLDVVSGKRPINSAAIASIIADAGKTMDDFTRELGIHRLRIQAAKTITEEKPIRVKLAKIKASIDKAEQSHNQTLREIIIAHQATVDPMMRILTALNTRLGDIAKAHDLLRSTYSDPAVLAEEQAIAEREYELSAEYQRLMGVIQNGRLAQQTIERLDDEAALEDLAGNPMGDFLSMPDRTRAEAAIAEAEKAEKLLTENRREYNEEIPARKAAVNAKKLKP